jgi:hypothetical protein
MRWIRVPPQENIPTSLLKMSSENASRAVKMFISVLKYQGEGGEQISAVHGFDIAQKLLHQGLKRSELKDELFMQLVKQTRGNPNWHSCAKAWELFHMVAATMPPSKVRRVSWEGAAPPCAHAARVACKPPTHATCHLHIVPISSCAGLCGHGVGVRPRGVG